MASEASAPAPSAVVPTGPGQSKASTKAKVKKTKMDTVTEAMNALEVIARLSSWVHP